MPNSNLEHSRYKDLLVWQRSLGFANEVIDLFDNIKTSRKHFWLFEQLEAAVTSVPMNIAEGKGLLEIFRLRGWIDTNPFSALEAKSNEIAKITNRLINSIARRL